MKSKKQKIGEVAPLFLFAVFIKEKDV